MVRGQEAGGPVDRSAGNETSRIGQDDEGGEILEFMQRLAALVPRPRLHLIRFHGVLARTQSCVVKSSPVRQSKQPRPHAITRRARRRA